MQKLNSNTMQFSRHDINKGYWTLCYTFGDSKIFHISDNVDLNQSCELYHTGLNFVEFTKQTSQGKFN
jgi:hypothetical protein